MRWLDFLFPRRVDEIALGDVSRDEFLALAAPRLVPATRPNAVVLLSFQNSTVRAAVHEAKYHGNVRAFKLLADVLVEYLRDTDDAGRWVSLVPVPLGAARRHERGFNQAEEIADRAASVLDGLTVDATLLVRTHETASQVSLPRHEREKNMRGAFRAMRGADPTRTYIVVDDVLTTGATLQAAVDALKEAGAEHIIPLALAH